MVMAGSIKSSLHRGEDVHNNNKRFHSIDFARVYLLNTIFHPLMSVVQCVKSPHGWDTDQGGKEKKRCG